MNTKTLLSTLYISSLFSLQAFAQQTANTAVTSTPANAPQQVPGTAAGQAPGAPAWINIALLVGIILFMWLFVFRPQAKRAKEQKGFLASLAPGVEVITAGGIIGTVTEVKENIVSLNVGNSTVRVLKNSISGKLDSSK